MSKTFRISKAIAALPVSDLSILGFRVLLTLCANRRGNECSLSVADLSKIIGISKAYIKKGLSELMSLHIIERKNGVAITYLHDTDWLPSIREGKIPTLQGKTPPDLATPDEIGRHLATFYGQIAE